MTDLNNSHLTYMIKHTELNSFLNRHLISSFRIEKSLEVLPLESSIMIDAEVFLVVISTKFVLHNDEILLERVKKTHRFVTASVEESLRVDVNETDVTGGVKVELIARTRVHHVLHVLRETQ